ncbi:ZZ-type zinc finger-containing protein 3 [Plodia interpunctella]|uniref:ZZ-type zinc finger-containing protein 3 n=1 Tax=Plodia interpunctella TaxID=58824 RepID=UPI00236796B0|nr:ZZ-type zinc finger-containing protein 3 [Plodia interpunctella]
MENLDITESENIESDGEFAFETDHLVLRGNKDYCELLKYIVKLEAQKVNALKDIEQLAEAESKALADPLKFVEDLKSGKARFPPRPTLADMPNIDWNQYGIDPSMFDSDGIMDTKPNPDELDTIKVRGRKFTDSKPETFNQLWSCEEQKRLEELLEIYPEEPIEARRYKKIARDLGTRTPIQVMCRIQKYFAKLAKAGLPIPGRAPKRVTRDKNKSIFYKKSTFFPQLHVPVKMEDLDSNDTQESYAPNDNKNSIKFKLGLLKLAKEQRILDETAPVYQTKTMCVGCQKSGFLGARWTDNAGTDYCTDCVVKLLPAERLIPVREISN